MNTVTHFLRFPDEATAISVMADYRGTDEQGNGYWITASLTHALDPVGTIYTPGTYDSTGKQLTAPVAQSGWHVNFIGMLPAAAGQYEIHPATPRRVFA